MTEKVIVKAYQGEISRIVKKNASAWYPTWKMYVLDTGESVSLTNATKK